MAEEVGQGECQRCAGRAGNTHTSSVHVNPDQVGQQDEGQNVPQQWHYQHTNFMLKGDMKPEQNTETLQTTAASHGR